MTDDIFSRFGNGNKKARRANKIQKPAKEPAPATPKIAKPTKKKPGRKRQFTPEEVAQRQRVRALEYKRTSQTAMRDIAPLPEININWDRRLATLDNLRLFCETYMQPVFYYGWSDDQLRCIEKTEKVFLSGGKFAMAMPRGGGKTAICRAAMLWGTLHAHKQFPFFIGSKERKAWQTLAAVKSYVYRSQLLLQDFPEICYPVLRIENRHHLAPGQLYNGELTYILWATNEIRFPSIILREEEARPYQEHIPEFLTYIEEFGGFLTKSAGIIVRTSGIDGSIRGDADTHPVTLTQPRPDVVLLDDIQKDQTINSQESCDKLVILIDGAIRGLGGPGGNISALMPCTVGREGDVASTYLDQNKKPEWQGERCSMVKSWPPGITDFDITKSTPAGTHWNAYAEIRRRSYLQYGDNRLGNEYYEKHREIMDEGFTVSWAERYNKESEPEISAQQSAMNLRLENPVTFLAEYQNIGRSDQGKLTIISSPMLMQKQSNTPHMHVPLDTQYLVAFIDPQNEINFYAVAASNQHYTGVFCDYGAWPDPTSRYFFKSMTSGWSLLSHSFFQTYPHHYDKHFRTADGHLRAPLEAKVYYGLTHTVEHLLSKEFIKGDTTMKIQLIGIDTKWGEASDAIKRYCRECPHNEVVPYYGHPFMPTNKQLTEYMRGGIYSSWLFEDNLHPQQKECKWVWKPEPTGMMAMMADVNLLKSFLVQRFASPPGNPGSFSLYQTDAVNHEMFCNHICDSEFPEPKTGRGLTKDCWEVRDGDPDNDYLDCATGCMALLSKQGACLQVNEGSVTAAGANIRGKLSDMYWHKRRLRTQGVRQ